jgi:hypothetical protein
VLYKAAGVTVIGIAIVFGVFLYMTSQTMCACEEEKIHFELDVVVEPRQVGDETRWDVTLHIDRATPIDDGARWDKLAIVVKDNDGSVLNTATPILPYDPDIYLDDTTHTQFWYSDTDMNGWMTFGETIVLTGLTEEYMGAYVEVVRGGERIGSISLPQIFP